MYVQGFGEGCCFGVTSLESLVDCISPMFLINMRLDSMKNSSGLERQDSLLQGKKKMVPALKSLRQTKLRRRR